jgi:hypothetical protein
MRFATFFSFGRFGPDSSSTNFFLAVFWMELDRRGKLFADIFSSETLFASYNSIHRMCFVHLDLFLLTIKTRSTLLWMPLRLFALSLSWEAIASVFQSVL